MLDKYKKIYQTDTESTSKVCVEWAGFRYKTAISCPSPSVIINFTYTSCDNFEQTVDITVPCTNGLIEDYMLLDSFCVAEDSVKVLPGVGVQEVYYGTSCE